MIATILGVLGPARAVNVPRSELGPFPFVERVRTSDFLAAEKIFGETLALQSDLVFLRVQQEAPATAIALTKRKSGEWFLLVVDVGRPGPDGKAPRKSLPIDAAVAAQVMKAVERILHENVMLPPQPRSFHERNDSWWIFFRDPKDVGITGVIENWGRHPARGSLEFMDGIVRNLRQLADAKPNDREVPLLALDEAARRIVLAPPVAR